MSDAAAANKTYEQRYRPLVEAQITASYQKFKALFDKAESNFTTGFGKCQESNTNVLDLLTAAMEALDNLELRVKELQNKIVELEQQQQQQPPAQPAVTSWAKMVSQGGGPSAPAKFVPTPEQLDLIIANADEVRERRLKETNVVIFGLPQAVGADTTSRMKQDEKTVRTLFTKQLSSRVAVGRIRRLAGPERKYDGPIIVSLDSVGSRNSILLAAKSLSKNVNFSHVFIHADETLAQRKQSKELREECKRLNVHVDGATPPTHRHCVRDGRILSVRLTNRAA